MDFRNGSRQDQDDEKMDVGGIGFVWAKAGTECVELNDFIIVDRTDELPNTSCRVSLMGFSCSGLCSAVHYLEGVWPLDDEYCTWLYKDDNIVYNY
jgi:hypothetical protein